MKLTRLMTGSKEEPGDKLRYCKGLSYGTSFNLK